MFRFFWVAVCFGGSLGLWAQPEPDAATVEADLARKMSTRYAPFAEWTRAVDPAKLADAQDSALGNTYWRSADAIRAARAESDSTLSLSGLHLALDPGHIGGDWADWEGRHFRMAEGDHWVREGELVLEVARRIRESLEALGARVTLLREDSQPVNPRRPVDYLERAAALVERPSENTFQALWAYGQALRAKAVGLSIISGDLAERARLVNEVIRPDVLISLHINAAVWPVEQEGVEELKDFGDGSHGAGGRSVPAAAGRCEHRRHVFSSSAFFELFLSSDSTPPTAGRRRLVAANHLHVLIFGCMSAAELASPGQRERLAVKLLNGSGAEEQVLANALGNALAKGSGLPPSVYGGNNAVRVVESNPYVFARNLMLLRLVDCPTILLEPYIANSETAYARIQRALSQRAAGEALAEDDILEEYAAAVVAGVIEVYGDR